MDGAGNLKQRGQATFNADCDNNYTTMRETPASTPITFILDDDGNLKSDDKRTFNWDGENRLAQVSGSQYQVTNRYDHQHRRVQKTVSLKVGSVWQVQYTDTFTYDGWNPVCQVRTGVSGVVTNHYLWGLDLAGQRTGRLGQGAGGIGGLVAIRVESQGATRIYLPVADQVGTIRSVISAATLATVAWFSYGTFGDVKNAWYADSQVRADLECASVRFMSKFQDPETSPDYAGPATALNNSGLVYYGYRYLNPITGKWTCRDPLGEQGGPNLTLAMNGDFVNNIDPLGLEIRDCESDPFILGLIPSAPSSIELGVKYKYGTTWWEDSASQVANIGYLLNNTFYGVLNFLCKDLPIKPNDNSPMTSLAIATAPVAAPLSAFGAAENGLSIMLSRMWTAARTSAAVGPTIENAARLEGKVVPCRPSGVCAPEACPQYGNACGVPSQVAPNTVVATENEATRYAASWEALGRKTGMLSDRTAREWYLWKESQIPTMLDSSASLERQAMQASAMRNQLRSQARSLMADREYAAFLDRTDPNMTWNQVVELYSSRGFSGDALWREIIKASQRSRTSVNKALGL